MIYKFKSAAAGDVIMLGPTGDQLLRLLGREPAAKGIIEVAAMPAALATLRAAIEQAERDAGEAAAARSDGGADEERRAAVGLRQRLWPMVQMLERARAAEADIVWGV